MSNIPFKGMPLDLSQPGRLHIRDMLKLFRVSKSTWHRGVDNGRYPKPDGYDGRMPYWKTATARTLLEN